MKSDVSISKRISFIGIGQFVNAAVNVLMVPYLARTLTTTEYGTYGQVLLTLSVVQVILSFGFSKLIYNYLSNSAEDSKESIKNVFAAITILSLIGISFTFIGSQFIADFFDNEKLGYYLKIYAFSLFFSLIVELLTSVLNFYKLVQQIAAITIFTNLLRITVLFIGVQFFKSLEIVFYGLLMVSILNALFLYIKNPLDLSVGKIGKKNILKQFKLGLPLSLSGVTTLLLVQTDGIMISRMLSTEDYAIYRMGAIPIPFLFIIYSSVITVTMPEVTKLFHQKKIEALLALKRKASLMVAVLIYPVLMLALIFSEEIVLFYLGEKYATSKLVFLIYNILLFLRINDYRDVLIAKGKTGSILKADLSIFILNIGLNYLLISQFGIAGAAVASILSYYLLSFLLLIFTSKEIKTGIGSFFHFKKLITVFFSSLLLGIGVYQLYHLINIKELIILFVPLYFIINYILLLKLKVVKVEELLNYTGNIKILLPLHLVLKKIG